MWVYYMMTLMSLLACTCCAHLTVAVTCALKAFVSATTCTTSKTPFLECVIIHPFEQSLMHVRSASEAERFRTCACTTGTQKHMLTHTHTHKHTRTHTHTHTHTRTHTYTHAHIHTRTHTHTQIHTHTSCRSRL